MDDEKKSSMCIILANADKAAVDGCDEEITLLSACCSIVKCLEWSVWRDTRTESRKGDISHSGTGTQLIGNANR